MPPTNAKRERGRLRFRLAIAGRGAAMLAFWSVFLAILSVSPRDPVLWISLTIWVLLLLPSIIMQMVWVADLLFLALLGRTVVLETILERFILRPIREGRVRLDATASPDNVRETRRRRSTLGILLGVVAFTSPLGPFAHWAFAVLMRSPRAYMRVIQQVAEMADVGIPSDGRLRFSARRVRTPGRSVESMAKETESWSLVSLVVNGSRLSEQKLQVV